MSSKSGPNPSSPERPPAGSRPWTRSIVARMTAWYAGSSLVLVLAATGFLYWVLADGFDAEDKRTLANTVTDLRLLLRASGDLHPSEPGGPTPAPASRQPAEIWMRVLGADGRTLLETPGMGAELPPSLFPPLARPADGRDSDGEVGSASGRRFQVLSARVSDDPARPDDRVLQVAMDRADEAELLVHYRERLWAVLVAAVLLCSATGYAIARHGMRPIERVTAAARRVRSSTLHERIDAADLPAELQVLAATFNEMLDRLEESFAQISRFSADVAHELRTPVGNLRGELEVALGKSRSAGEYRDALGSALEECLRLNRVIQSLLFLARAEAATGAPRHDAIRVRREIDAVLEFHDAAAAEAGVTLRAEDADGLVAPFDRTLFQQAVSNLVANAIAHTPPGGRVTVRAGGGGGVLRVEVIDTGRGIAPEHLPYILDRFYRADRARSGSGGNLGLGLAVVRSIAALHGGRVSVESEVGRGTRVTLETPLAAQAARPPGAAPGPA